MKIYYSKIGLKLVGFLILIFGIVGYLITKDNFNLGAMVVFLLPILFFIYLFTSIQYIVDKSNLNIKAGFLMNENIDIKKISRIAETNNLLSSPAASLDRLEISYNQKNRILISPKKKQEFIDHLLLINPEIEVIYKK